MSRLLLAFYGDDFTGSTDALEQLTLGGIKTVLFVKSPTPARLKRFPNLQAIGVAGTTRAMTPAAMKRVLRPALEKLKRLGARHIHYKICSTFDSSPRVGNLGSVIDVAMEIFRVPFVPLLVAAPNLGRYTVFGNHFARYGTGSAGEIYRLDRHPAISKHPITPMTEADLRVHLAKQTKRKIILFDFQKIMMPEKVVRAELGALPNKNPAIVLFDALLPGELPSIGKLIDAFASAKLPLFSIGSSGIETALASLYRNGNKHMRPAGSAKQILVGSGSCSPVTLGQISWSLKNGFAGILLDPNVLISPETGARAIRYTVRLAVKALLNGRSVVLYTCKKAADKRVARKFKGRSAQLIGVALGRTMNDVLAQSSVRRVCIAGGDTSGYAAKTMGIEALEMIAPLIPGAPLCKAYAQGMPVDGREIIFKGGQVGPENYFELIKNGST